MVDLNFFCSPIGLGHATRDVAIANNLENIHIQFITGNKAAKFLSAHGFTVKDVYNPPQFDVKNGLLENSAKWLWRYFQYYKDCKKIAKNIIENKNSKLVVSDEDFASLTIAQKEKTPTVLITDILETRFTEGFASIIEKKMNNSMKDIITKCDVVILPEKGNDHKNIKRVGPIVRQINQSRDELRKEFGFKKKTLLVSVGGTNAGKFLIDKVIELIPKISDVELVIASGPSLQIEYENIKNLGFVKNLHELIYAADVIVSLAGKSTIDEAISYGTPGIFIPIKDHFEQEDNARDLGFIYDDIFRLDSLIEKKLQESRKPISADGATKAARIIKELL